VGQRLTAAGHRVTALVHHSPPAGDWYAQVTTAIADLRDREEMRRVIGQGRFEAVCHIGALTNGRESLERPLPYFDVNVGGTIALLQALDEARVTSGTWARLVFASTQAVYGSSEETPIAEDRMPQPTNAYGASKLAAERLIAYHAATGALGAMSLRCFNVAGAIGLRGDRDLTRVIPKALAVAAGEAPFFPLNDDGSAVREFVHVADVADAFLLALQAARQGEFEAMNIGTGVGITMRETLSVVERVTSRSVAVRVLPSKPEPKMVIADVSRARRRLGWTPTRSDVDTIVHDAWSATR
jgi:UDP-glucose 4-epimerase